MARRDLIQHGLLGSAVLNWVATTAHSAGMSMSRFIWQRPIRAHQIETLDI